jgi:hypothetical protein
MVAAFTVVGLFGAMHDAALQLDFKRHTVSLILIA